LDDATTGDGMLTAIKMAWLVSISGPLESLVAVRARRQRARRNLASAE